MSNISSQITNTHTKRHLKPDRTHTHTHTQRHLNPNSLFYEKTAKGINKDTCSRSFLNLNQNQDFLSVLYYSKAGNQGKIRGIKILNTSYARLGSFSFLRGQQNKPAYVLEIAPNSYSFLNGPPDIDSCLLFNYLFLDCATIQYP